MKELEFKYEKINEEDLEVTVTTRYEGFPYSCSPDKIRIYNVHLKHKPSGLEYNVDSNTGIDTGYQYALKELEKILTKFIAKKRTFKVNQGNNCLMRYMYKSMNNIKTLTSSYDLLSEKAEDLKKNEDIVYIEIYKDSEIIKDNLVETLIEK